MTLYILYSADYELYLGGNYCDETEVLIDPTNNLLDLFENLKIPLTLFADIFSILCYRKYNLLRFPESAEAQLKDAIRRGHDVQSHVHPHWNYTQIIGNTYDVNLDYYLLGNLDTDKEILYSKICDNLLTTRIYLQNLLRQVKSDYTCIAFRAGGYGLQPNSDIVIKALIDSGFVIDSSIVPGLIATTNVNEVDFSIVPKIANYYLDNDIGTVSENNQGIYEIPIASCTFKIVEIFLYQMKELFASLQNKITQKKSDAGMLKERGYSIQQHENQPRQSKYYNFIKSYNDRFYYLNCSTNDEKMFHCTKRYLSRFDFKNTNIFLSFNMHPKGMTVKHFNALENYHTALKNYYQNNIQFISYQQAAEMITKKPL